MKSKIVPALMLCMLFFAGHAAAWYNDAPANDSRLMIQSDSENYYFDGAGSREFTVLLYIENPLPDFDGALGVFFRDKDLDAAITKTQSLDKIEIKIVQEQKSCDGKIVTSTGTEKNELHVSCLMDVNAKKDVVAWSGDFNKIDGKIATKNIEISEKVFKEVSLTKTKGALPYPKSGFSEKAGYTIPIKHGGNYFTITISVPLGELHARGEFVFTLKNPFNSLQYSTLHPSWWESGEFTPDAHTVALWHFNDNTGTNANDSGTNNYDLTLSNAGIWDATTKKFGASCISPNDLYYGTQATIFDAAVPANWTISAWVSPTVLHNNTDALYETWFDRYTDPSGKRLTCRWILNNGFLRCNVDPTGAGGVEVQSDRVVWEQNTWYYVQLIYDGTNVELYVDGVLEDTAIGANYVATASEFVVGANLEYGSISHFRIDEMDISDVDRNATPYSTAPPVVDANFLAPLENTSTEDNTPLFALSGENADSCEIGFIANGVPDYNTGVDFNLSNGAARTYIALENAGDEVYAVINHCMNGATNYDVVKKSASFILYQKPLSGANPRDITNKNFVNAGLYGIYSLFAGIGAYATAIILFILACLFLVFIAWLLTR